jgi:hypothetical protein
MESDDLLMQGCMIISELGLLWVGAGSLVLGMDQCGSY